MRPACATPSTWKTAPRSCAPPAAISLNPSPPSVKMAPPSGHRCNGSNDLSTERESCGLRDQLQSVDAVYRNSAGNTRPAVPDLARQTPHLPRRELSRRRYCPLPALTRTGLSDRTYPSRGPRIRPGSSGPVSAQGQRVPRRHARQLPRTGGTVQLQLPLCRERTLLSPERLPRRGAGLQRRVRPAGCRSPRRLPTLKHLIKVEDQSGNPLLPGAVAYESIVDTALPAAPMPVPTGDELYILYTGGTTGMPKGVLWRQRDIFVSAMGGRLHSSTVPFASYHDIVEQVRSAAGSMSSLLLPPLMHGAAQWMAFQAITLGGFLAIPDRVDRLQPAEVLRLAEREGVRVIPVVGDAIARPLVAEIQAGDYDLSNVLLVTNGGAALSPVVRDALKAVLPHAALMDAVGASESGSQMSVVISADHNDEVSVFTPQPDTAVLAEDLSRVLTAGAGGEGWLARRDYIPLGYMGDRAKTEKTFPTVDGVRWSVPGDRARALPDGRLGLLGRDSATINSGGEKIFAEEVERAVACHPAVYDVIVVGRPSQRWGSEVVAVVQLVDGAEPTDTDLREACAQHLARYKIPKSFVRTTEVVRSPAGKADYRWAKQVAARDTHSHHDDRDTAAAL